MAANNIVARHVVDELSEFSRETVVPSYMKFFFGQQLAEIRHRVSRQRKEAQKARNNLTQLRALFAKLETMNDNGVREDPKLCLKADIREEKSRLEDLKDVIAADEDHIVRKEGHVELMERRKAFAGHGI